MTEDPVDRAVQRGGLEPTAQFQDRLESTLVRGIEGAPLPGSNTPATSGRSPWPRVVVASVAGAAAAIVIAVVIVQNDSDNKSVIGATTLESESVTTASSPLTTTVTSEATTDTTIVSAVSTTTQTTLPITTAPQTTAAPTTVVPTTTGPTTNAPPPPSAVIDLTSSSPPLEPTVIASYPVAPPGDLFDTAYAAPAGSGRFAVLDAVTGIIRFADVSSGRELGSYQTPVPTIGDQTFIGGLFFVGPDDVLYVPEVDASGSTSIAAYGLDGDAYVEVARAAAATVDTNFTLGPSGITAIHAAGPYLLALADTPTLAYVALDGQPSGAQLDVLGVETEGLDGEYTVARGGRLWRVNYLIPPDFALCEICDATRLGPGSVTVLVNRRPAEGGDLQGVITILDDQITTYDSDWTYVGYTGNQLLFSRLDQDSIDIATMTL